MNALLIESHPLLRLGLHQMLERIEGIDQVIAIDPADVSLLDGADGDTDLMVFGMPPDPEAGWQLLSQVRRILNAQRVLLLSDTVPLQVPAAAMAQGVCGCLPKTASLAVLEAAIRLAMVGGYFVRGNGAASALTSPLADTHGGAFGGAYGGAYGGTYGNPYGGPYGGANGGPIVATGTNAARGPMSAPSLANGHPASPAASRSGVVPPHAATAVPTRPAVSEGPSESTYYDEAEMLQITPRQYEVLVLLARGHPIKTVSRMLNISVATVKSHACTLYQRLKVRNKGEAVYTALQRGAKLEWVHGDGATPSSVTRMARPAPERGDRSAELPLQAGGGMR